MCFVGKCADGCETRRVWKLQIWMSLGYSLENLKLTLVFPSLMQLQLQIKTSTEGELQLKLLQAAAVLSSSASFPPAASHQGTGLRLRLPNEPHFVHSLMKQDNRKPDLC